VPHIHTKSVLNEIEHWQDEKEANQSKRQAVMARIKEESDKKLHQSNSARQMLKLRQPRQKKPKKPKRSLSKAKTMLNQSNKKRRK